MTDWIIITILFIVAFLIALKSTSELDFGSTIEQIIQRKKIKGTIVFFKDKVVHYSPQSSDSSSPSS